MQTPEERFWKKVKKTETCWLWTGAKLKTGYGIVRINKINYTAHRAAYMLFVGPVPPDVYVCHTCDNTSCIRPDHLWLGSNSENIKDCVQKGRWKNPTRRGVLHHKNKLREDEVLSIRDSTKSYTVLAALYGVSVHTIWSIRKRLIWKHI